MFNVPESMTTLADGVTVFQHRDLVELLLSQHAQPGGCAQVAVEGICVCLLSKAFVYATHNAWQMHFFYLLYKFIGFKQSTGGSNC